MSILIGIVALRYEQSSRLRGMRLGVKKLPFFPYQLTFCHDDWGEEMTCINHTYNSRAVKRKRTSSSLMTLQWRWQGRQEEKRQQLQRRWQGRWACVCFLPRFFFFFFLQPTGTASLFFCHFFSFFFQPTTFLRCVDCVHQCTDCCINGTKENIEKIRGLWEARHNPRTSRYPVVSCLWAVLGPPSIHSCRLGPTQLARVNG